MNEQRDHLDSMIKQVFSKMKKLTPKAAKCPDDEVLAAYLTGNLSEEERERIEEHLVVCRDCAENLISSSEVESSYQSTEETFTTKEMLKRAKDLVKPRGALALWERVSSWFTVFRPVPVMVAASVILVVVAFGVYNLRRPSGLSPELPPSIMFNIIAKMPSEVVTRGMTPDFREVDLQDGGVLHSGDMFRIKFELQEEAYVYLVSLDSLGNLTKIFPEKDTRFPIKVKPHKTYIVPKGNGWFRLDHNTGQETFYLLASPETIGNIDQRIDQLKKSGIDKITKILPGVKIQSFTFRHE